MNCIDKFVNDENVRQTLSNDNPLEQFCEPGPYLVKRGEWTYDAHEVDKTWSKRAQIKDDVIPVGGQFQLVVTQADGFTKALIPYDEGDGHSAAEALHALQALNGYDVLMKAAKKVVDAADVDVLNQALDNLRTVVQSCEYSIAPGQNEADDSDDRPAL